jgi:hypothetical protein
MGNPFYRTDAEDQIPNPPSELNIPMDEEMDEMYSFEEGDDMDEMDSLMEAEEEDMDEEMDSLMEEEDEE